MAASLISISSSPALTLYIYFRPFLFHPPPFARLHLFIVVVTHYPIFCHVDAKSPSVDALNIEAVGSAAKGGGAWRLVAVVADWRRGSRRVRFGPGGCVDLAGGAEGPGTSCRFGPACSGNRDGRGITNIRRLAAWAGTVGASGTCAEAGVTRAWESLCGKGCACGVSQFQLVHSLHNSTSTEPLGFNGEGGTCGIAKLAVHSCRQLASAELLCSATRRVDVHIAFRFV